MDWTKVVCVDCNREMRVDSIGVPAVELDEGLKPYKLCYGDICKCPNCGKKTLARWGRPFNRHDARFEENLASAKEHPLYFEFN